MEKIKLPVYIGWNRRATVLTLQSFLWLSSFDSQSSKWLHFATKKLQWTPSFRAKKDILLFPIITYFWKLICTSMGTPVITVTKSVTGRNKEKTFFTSWLISPILPNKSSVALAYFRIFATSFSTFSKPSVIILLCNVLKFQHRD